MHEPLRLSVSIVVYHSPFGLLDAAVESLECAMQFAQADGMDLRLVLDVIDNSGRKAYREQLQDWVDSGLQGRFESVNYLCSGRNLGYGAGHNLSIVRACSDYHLVLNPDVSLADDALLAGLQFMQDNPDVIMVNPRAVNTEGRSQHLCKRYPSLLVLFLRAFAPRPLKRLMWTYMSEYELRDQDAPSAAVAAPLMSGCCMLATTDALHRVDGFSERFFMYFEDFDLSMRLLPLGRLMFYPQMQIVHHGGYSARKGLRHIAMFAHSGWKFFRRHGWSWI